MIPIIKSHEFQKQLSKNKPCDALDNYFNRIAYKASKPDRGFVKDAKILDDWCKANGVTNLFSSFKDIVEADNKKLKKIKEHIDKNLIAPLGKIEKAAIERLYKDRLNRIGFIKSLEITVCPYCNRNYINSTKDRTLCQFDHFFNKAKYPLFYVSFFNLVPVCASCNHIKGELDFEYSPHDTNFGAEELITFSYKLKSANITDPKNIEITVSGHEHIIKNNISKLRIEEIYQIHTDFVSDLYKKSQIFNDAFVNMLYSKFRNLFASKSEIKQLIVGGYINENEYHKRPLSKMVHDISKSFRLI